MSADATPRPERPRLEPAAVVTEAVRLLDEQGFDAVSMRAVADRLGVRMNTVLWHIKSKARLRELMADALIGEVSLTDLPQDWEPRVRELFHRDRRALLAHRDGAAVVTGTYAPDPHTLRFADELSGTLLGAGLGRRETSWAVWTLVYYTLGLVQEEQALPGARRSGLHEAVTERDLPGLHRILDELDVLDFDERFDFGLTLLLTSLRQRAEV